jgi:hypothetical protein
MEKLEMSRHGGQIRIEQDSLGTIEVPSAAY